MAATDLGRRLFSDSAGLAITLALHGALIGVVMVAHSRPAPPLQVTRDLVVAKLVKLGKPREKFWLPRLAAPPKPKAPQSVIKLSDDPNAPAATPEAPRPEDAEVSKSLKRALERARALSQSAPEEPAEGLATGVADGTASEGNAGDEYATAVAAAIRRHWTVPAELVGEAELAKLEAEVRVQISADGELSEAKLLRPSGSSYYDDACMAAVNAARRVPPPPEKLRRMAARGFAIVFAGKEVGR